MEREITGVVLAGGESSRMGEDKSIMIFREKQLIDFSIKALSPYCSKIFISSSKEIHDDFNQKRIEDKYQKIGPIAGIQSALENSKTDYVIVLPCDSPMVKKEFVEFLISQIDDKYDVLVPKYQSHLEPLFAVYHKRILPIIEEQITNKNYKLMNLISKINSKKIEVQDRTCFVNINTQEDFRKYLEK